MSGAPDPARAGAPVVLGSSMSGLLVSLALSRAGIRHVLVGGAEPGATPRLGESLNEVAGPELWRRFGRDLSRFFYRKAHISLMNGSLASLAYISDPNRSLADMARYAGGDAFHRPIANGTLFHLDRAGFDPVVYRMARGDRHCTFLERRITGLEVSRDTDAVCAVTLDDGSVLRDPSYVLDATGPRALVAAAAGVGETAIAAGQRVVWSHYRREEGACARLWWLHGTNLLRLRRELDGIDGMAWMIPLGTSLSVGVSLEAAGADGRSLDTPAVLRLLDAAYRRRGLDYRAVYPEAHPQPDVVHTYGVRDRAYGRNWLLVGGSFITGWFPASSGLWTATAAAGLIPELLAEPMRVGAYYESIMRGGVLGTHRLLDRLVCGPAFAAEADVHAFWTAWMAFIPNRVAAYIRIATHDITAPRLDAACLRLLSRLHGEAPRVAELMGTSTYIHARRTATLAEQGDSFPGYFRPLGFRARGYLRGLPVVLGSALRAPG
jgi:flavin-dependent dehydrogenase